VKASKLSEVAMITPHNPAHLLTRLT